MTVRILTGDCRDVLKTLPDESVHCVVTSPPYFGLRDYGTAQWEGGADDCDHTSVRRNHDGEKQGTQAGSSRDKVSRDCRLCGATRTDNQIGLEPTPDAFVAEMVAVFREVRRVLRADGTCWLNLGDSYANTGNKGQDFSASNVGYGGKGRGHIGGQPIKAIPIGLKQKDLIGIPWRVAFALQADGWYLRQDIIWSKPNPMPESVTDRCTKAHEYLFLLSKSPRYYYDADAIAEQSKWADDNRAGEGRLTYDGKRQGEPGTGNEAFVKITETRNRRSVWEVATQPFSEAHFATFPPALIEPCIKAGCPVGGTVLDPFAGAGTTGLVADRLQRSAILIELNAAYADMARDRIHGDAPLFSPIEPPAKPQGASPAHFAEGADGRYLPLD